MRILLIAPRQEMSLLRDNHRNFGRRAKEFFSVTVHIFIKRKERNINRKFNFFKFPKNPEKRSMKSVSWVHFVLWTFSSTGCFPFSRRTTREPALQLFPESYFRPQRKSFRTANILVQCAKLKLFKPNEDAPRIFCH